MGFDQRPAGARRQLKPNQGETEMNVVFFTDGYAICAINGRLFETSRLHEGKYISIDDTPARGLNARYPQLCKHGLRTGATLTYYSDKVLAAALDAQICDEWEQFVRYADVYEGEWNNIRAPLAATNA